MTKPRSVSSIPGATDIARQVDSIWNTNKEAIDPLLFKWTNAMENGATTVARERSKFCTHGPLMVYVSQTNTGSKSTAEFSLRFLGQSVGTLVVSSEKKAVCLRISRSQAGRFGAKLTDRDYAWSDGDQQVREFKRYFEQPRETLLKQAARDNPEARIESQILQLMRGRPKRYLRSIRPVLIGRCPLQIPIPISANTGEPAFSKRGHIDIAARHGRGRNIHPAVWELKKPGGLEAKALPVPQAYIYAATLLKILRSTKHGQRWYKLLGFGGSVPKTLVVDTVVAVSRNQEAAVQKQFELYRTSMPAVVGTNNDRIHPYVAFYDVQGKELRISDPKRLD